MSKVICTISLLVVLSQVSTFAQSLPETPKTFQNARLTDFTKLLGAQKNTEGVKLSYSTEKTDVEGTVGQQLWSKSLLLFTGSVGTTTNLSTLLNQKVLPVMSGTISFNLMLPGTKYYYDNSILRKAKRATEDDFAGITTGDSRFNYRESFLKDLKQNRFSGDTAIYTSKRLIWGSLAGNYENSKYSFYDPNRAFASQQYDTLYSSFSGKLNINGYMYWNQSQYKWRSFRPQFVFLNLYLKYGPINNIAQLKKTTINDVSRTIVDPVSGTSREVTKSQSDYTGVYKNYHAITPGFEWIFAPIRVLALDIFGEKNFLSQSDKIKYNTSDYASIACGIYFYSASSGASNLNIGVYYKWTQDPSSSSWTGQLGIKTSIPITPL